MKRQILQRCLLLVTMFVSLTSCRKENTWAQNEKNIKKDWKLDQYFINDADKTNSMIISGYTESYTDNGKYNRSYTDKNSNLITQDGSYKFESAQQVHVSGTGSIAFLSNNTVSSSYYNIIRLTDRELWYSFTNGNEKHEFHLSRK